MSGDGRARERRDRERGQSLIEFAFVVPLFLLILLGVLEFGLAFSHNLTLAYATREGARAGAAIADASGTDSACVDAISGLPRALTASDVDPLIIAAVQRVLKSSGSLVNLANITQVVIYKADASGGDTGAHNIWQYRPGDTSNPEVPCQAPAEKLDFYELSHSWQASARNNGGTPDHLGVSITYNYKLTTPLGAVMSLAARASGSAWSSITMSDKSVMALEPTTIN